MFKNCTSLLQLKETFLLPNSTKSYKGMFDNCIELKQLPELFQLHNNTENIAYMFRNTKLSKFPQYFTLPASLIDASEAFESMPYLSIDISDLIHTEFTNTRNIDFYMTFKNTSGLYGEIPTQLLWNSNLHFTSRQCFKGCSRLVKDNAWNQYNSYEQGIDQNMSVSIIPKNWGGDAAPVWHPDESVFTSVATSGTIIRFNHLSDLSGIIVNDIDNNPNKYVSGDSIFIDWGYNTHFNEFGYTCEQDMEDDAWIRIYNATYFNTSSLIIDYTYYLSQQLNQYNSMFEDSKDLLALDTNLIFNSVTDYSNLFKNCIKLNDIKAPTFLTDSYEYNNIILNSMFENCKSLSSISDVALFGHITKVTNTEYNQETGEEISSQEVDYVQMYNNHLPDNTTQCIAMFKDCHSLTGLPNCIQFYNTKLIDCTSAFQNCYTITGLDWDYYDLDINSNYIFSEPLTGNYQQQIEIAKIIPDSVTGCTHLLDGCSSLISVPDHILFGISAASIDYMFNNCYSLTGINPDIELYNIISSANYTFNNCSSLIMDTLYLGFKFEHILETNYMFNNVPINAFYQNFTMPKIGRKMDNMFGNIPILSSDISNIWYWYDAQGEGDETPISSVISCSGTLINNKQIVGHAPSKYLWYNQFIDFENPYNYFKDCTKINNYNYIPEEWGGPNENGRTVIQFQVQYSI